MYVNKTLKNGTKVEWSRRITVARASVTSTVERDRGKFHQDTFYTLYINLITLRSVPTFLGAYPLIETILNYTRFPRRTRLSKCFRVTPGSSRTHIIMAFSRRKRDNLDCRERETPGPGWRSKREERKRYSISNRPAPFCQQNLRLSTRKQVIVDDITVINRHASCPPYIYTPYTYLSTRIFSRAIPSPPLPPPIHDGVDLTVYHTRTHVQVYNSCLSSWIARLELRGQLPTGEQVFTVGKRRVLDTPHSADFIPDRGGESSSRGGTKEFAMCVCACRVWWKGKGR